MKIDFDDRFEDYHKKSGSYIVKLRIKEGIVDDETAKVFRMTSLLQRFSSTSKKIMHFTRDKTDTKILNRAFPTKMKIQ